VINLLGPHPLTLNVFAFLVIRGYNSDLVEATNLFQSMGLRIAHTDSDSRDYHRQLGKLRMIVEELIRRLSVRELFIMKQLSTFYGEVYERDYQILTKDQNPDDPEFKFAMKNLVNSSLITEGNRGGKPTVTAHRMAKQVIYELMKESERIKTHISLAKYFEKYSKPTKPKSLTDLDDLMECFHHCIKGNLFREAFEIWEKKNGLKDMLYHGGWFEAHSELIESLSSKFLENPEELTYEEQILLYMIRGHVTRKLGKVKDAFESFNKVLEISSEHNFEMGEYEAKIEIGVTLGFEGKFEDSLQILPREELEPKSLYDSARLEWTGYCEAILGNYGRGVELLEKSIMICCERKDYRHLPPTLSHLGDVYTLLGKYDSALEKYEEAR